MSTAKVNVTGIVLAGGMGRRMGNADKGLLLLRGKPLVAHVLERLRPQVTELLINANRGIDTYARFGYSVVTDLVPGFAGPLAGLHSGMTTAKYPLIATAPCDAPFLPADLVSRLLAALQQQQADIAVAHTGGQAHPVFSLCHTALQSNLAQFIAQGGRRVGDWHASLHTVAVAFDDEADAFANINTPEELACLE